MVTSGTEKKKGCSEIGAQAIVIKREKLKSRKHFVQVPRIKELGELAHLSNFLTWC